MASTITAETPVYSLSATFLDNGIKVVEHADLRDLLYACASLNNAENLDKVKIQSPSSNVWKLNIDTKLGLKWFQDFLLDPVTNKFFTKAHLPQFWDYGTVTNHRYVRDAIVRLLLDHDLIALDLIYKD